MSRQDLADAVNAHLFRTTGREFAIDANYVGKLERGQIRWPHAEYRDGFGSVLGAASPAKLGFFITRPGTSDVGELPPPTHPPRPGEDGDGAGYDQEFHPSEVSSVPTRRELIEYLGAGVLAAALGEKAAGQPRVADALLLTRAPHASGVDDVSVETLQELVDYYQRAVRNAPLGELYAELLEVRRYAGSLATELTPPRRTWLDLTAAIGALSHLLAVVTQDFGDQASALVWCADAERRADEAGHAELAGWAAQTRVILAYYQGQARAAVAHARRGQRLAPAGTTAHAQLAAQEMRMCALLGDARATAAARRRAERAIAQLPGDTPTQGIFSISLAEDPPYTGTSLLLLGRHADALAATRRVVARFYDSGGVGAAEHPSGYARTHLVLGLALAGVGSVDEAHAAGCAALEAPRLVWPVVVLAGKLDSVMRTRFAGSAYAGDYHERYVAAAELSRASAALPRGDTRAGESRSL
jgi:tetratricopeptide (TPR) repeat protein